MIVESKIKDGLKVYLPSLRVSFTLQNHLNDIKKLRDEGKEADEIFFTKKEDCIAYIRNQSKLFGYMDSIHYRKAMALIKLFYPNITIESIEKYILGWYT